MSIAVVKNKSEKGMIVERKIEAIAIIILVMITIFLRVAFPAIGPNGWRDDELSNVLVISQKVLDGDIRLYYPDASGHEGFYHWLQALFFSVFDETYFGIRGASVGFGVVSIVLVYLIIRSLLNWKLAALSSLLLTSSFWSLLYSRTGHRHISAVALTSLTFFFLIKAIRSDEMNHKWRFFISAGVAGGLSLYTYSVARGLPFILIAFLIYLRIYFPKVFRINAKGISTTLGIILLMALPLIIILTENPSAETRVSEVALPLRDALDGDFSTMGQYAMVTFSMFTHDGDDEVLYNIPHRPVFSFFWGILLWGGVVLSLWRAFKRDRDDPLMGLLLTWFFASLIPGVLSVPAASLSHTILAQMPAYIFPVISVDWLKNAADKSKTSIRLTPFLIGLIAAFSVFEVYRGIHDFFFIWPQDGFNRMHHHSALREAANVLNEHGGAGDLVMAGFMSERWDQLALRIDLDSEWVIREFDPYSAMIFIRETTPYIVPDFLDDTWGVREYLTLTDTDGHLYSLDAEIPFENPLATFNNGLALLDVYESDEVQGAGFVSVWRVTGPLDLPDFPLYAKPPGPGEDNGPRLRIFFHILDDANQWVAGADAIGVDPYTLQTGDVFLQRHVINDETLLSGCYSIAIGLYNPITGERVRLVDYPMDSYTLTPDTGLMLCIP